MGRPTIPGLWSRCCTKATASTWHSHGVSPDGWTRSSASGCYRRTTRRTFPPSPTVERTILGAVGPISAGAGHLPAGGVGDTGTRDPGCDRGDCQPNEAQGDELWAFEKARGAVGSGGWGRCRGSRRRMTTRTTDAAGTSERIGPGGVGLSGGAAVEDRGGQSGPGSRVTSAGRVREGGNHGGARRRGSTQVHQP